MHLHMWGALYLHVWRALSLHILGALAWSWGHGLSHSRVWSGSWRRGALVARPCWVWGARVLAGLGGPLLLLVALGALLWRRAPVLVAVRGALVLLLPSIRAPVLVLWPRAWVRPRPWPLLDRGQVLGRRLPPLPRRGAAPEGVTPHYTPRPAPPRPPIALVAPHDLPLQVHRGDGAGVQHGLGAVRGAGPSLCTHQRGPLLGQAHEFTIVRVETRVDAVLEIRGGRNVDFLLFLGEHSGGWRGAATTLKQ